MIEIQDFLSAKFDDEEYGEDNYFYFQFRDFAWPMDKCFKENEDLHAYMIEIVEDYKKNNPEESKQIEEKYYKKYSYNDMDDKCQKHLFISEFLFKIIEKIPQEQKAKFIKDMKNVMDIKQSMASELCNDINLKFVELINKIL